MKAKIAAIGRVVDPPSTALLYAPLQAKPPYAGVKVTRDIAYGADARNILDLFQPADDSGKRPVLIFLAGGYNAGSLMLQLKESGGKLSAEPLFRLKPAEFLPYDYTQENYTQLLWFF